MNDLSRELGLANTNYVIIFNKKANPHGLPNRNNISTAYD